MQDKRPISFFYIWMSSFRNTYWKDYYFPIAYYWSPCWRFLDHIRVNLFWALYSIHLVYVSVFISVPCSLLSIALQFSLKPGIVPLALFFFLKITCRLLVFCGSQIILELFLYISVKIVIGIFIGITLNLYIVLCSIDILTIWILPIMNIGSLYIYFCLQFFSSVSF